MARARWIVPWADSETKPAIYHCIARVVDRRFAFLGDLVGYGADPLACLDIIAGMVEEGALALRGNHDEACLGGQLEAMLWPSIWQSGVMNAPNAP